MRLYERYEDPELAHLMQNDDRQAFTTIYHRYWKLLFSIAVNKLHTVEDAEEIVQDIFASLWIRRADITIEVSLKAWLAGSVKLKIYTRLAQKYRERELAQQFPVSPDVIQPSTDLELKDLQTRIDLATAQLPERCRLVYQLSREKGLSHKDIATQLDISEKTVENQITRALKGIRSAIRSSFFSLFT